MDIVRWFEVIYRQAAELAFWKPPSESTEMYVITKEGVESLVRRLLDPVEAGGCRSELEKMLEIKEVLSWRADAGPCCAARVMSPGLFGEAQLLQAALQAFDKGSHQEAAALVSEFSHVAERNGSYRLW
jgi:hypothetical protein